MRVRQLLLSCTLLASLVLPAIAHPFGSQYDEEYVDEDEPMDPPSPYHRPSPMAFAKKSSPAPMLSYPTALEGTKAIKPTPPDLLQDQKFKIPQPRPVYVTPALVIKSRIKVETPSSFMPDDIPYGPAKVMPVKKNNQNFVTISPPKKKTLSTTTTTPPPVSRPLPKKPTPKTRRPPPRNQQAPVDGKKKQIKHSSSIVSPKYAQHPSHTLASYPHFLPTVEPSYQMVPAAQQEYNIASIGAVGLLSGGSVDDGHGGEESAEGFSGAYGHQDEHQDSDAKYEFMYRVQGDEKYAKDEDSHSEPSDFGHSEAREGDRTWGRYFVKLPDGRIQTVRYWADHTGYHAEVLFQGEAQHPEGSPHDHPAPNSYSNHAPTFRPHQPSFAALSEEAEGSPSLPQEAHVASPAYGPASFTPYPPLYSSQPAYVPPTPYYEAAASENVKSVEKLPSTLASQKQKS